jgi:hypothetical protein
MNGFKQFYNQITKALTQPIPFWFSPAGILIIVTLFWVASTALQPIILTDTHPDLKAIAGIRLWIAEKIFYFLAALTAALIAQNQLHKNAIKREVMLAKARSSQELVKEYSELRSAAEGLKNVYLKDLPNQAFKLQNQFKSLISKANAQDNHLYTDKIGLEAFNDTLNGAIEILTNPIPKSNLGPQRKGYPTIKDTFDQLYSKNSTLAEVMNGFVAHSEYVTLYSSKLNKAYLNFCSLAYSAHSHYQSIAHRII